MADLHPPRPTQRRRRRLAIVLGAMWLFVLVVVVAVTLSTRSELVGTNDGAGIAVVVATMPAILLAVCLLRQPFIAVLTMIVAAIATWFLASGILNGESSTAAVGVIVIPPTSLLIVGVGIVAQLLLSPREQKPKPARGVP